MKAQKRLSILLVLLLVTLNVTPLSAQTKRKTTKSAPNKLPIAAAPQSVDDKEAVAIVEKLLLQIEPKATRSRTAPIWVVRRKGPTGSYFSITLSVRGETLVTQVNVAKKTSFRLNDAAPALLSLAYQLDYAKVGFDPEGDVWVRNEARIKSLDLDELSNNLERITTAADQVLVKLSNDFKIK